MLEEPYNSNFKDSELVDDYLREWQSAYPLYNHDRVSAVLGGWHFPFPDGDWHELVNSELCVFTVHQSEPWIECWRDAKGTFRVIQRIT